jgi:hypothetical protein
VSHNSRPTHEHRRTLELASAALDFSLPPDEARELDDGLQECAECRDRAAAYGAQRQLLARLPILDASDVTRVRITRAAAGHAQRSPDRTWLALLAALLLIGGLIGGVTVGALPVPQLGVVLPGQSESPTPSQSGGPSQSAEPSTPSLPPSPQVGDLLPDTIAVVTDEGDNLRMRSLPTTGEESQRFEPLLSSGDRVFVLEGPVAADGYRWYHVASLDWLPTSTDEDVDPPAGWIAQASLDGKAWVASADVACPQLPLELTALARLHPFERLACYGDQALSFRAYVPEGDGSGRLTEPVPDEGFHWLQQGISIAPIDVNDDLVDRAIILHDQPGSHLAWGDIPTESWVDITARLDNAAAGECPILSDQAPAEVWILECRSSLVADTIVPAAPLLAHDAVAAVTQAGDGLRVRSLPTTAQESERLEPLLSAGTEVFIIDGPVAADGYDWYEIIAFDTEVEGGLPLIGWSAVADRDSGEAWLRPQTVGCGSEYPLDVDHLAGLGGSGGLDCFGSEELTLQAARDSTCGEGSSSWIVEPGWFLTREIALVQLDAQGTYLTDIGARLHPEVVGDWDDGVCTPDYQPVMAQVTGHYDDPAAEDCSIRDPERAQPEIDPRYAAYWCRTAFVVTRVERP